MIRCDLNSPLVSIVLPVYNGKDYLAQSIESCLNQSYSNIELIIVNDSSTDNSLEIAEKYALEDKRIKIVSNEINLNLPCSLNIGHRLSRGVFITWTSHDNFYESRAIEVMLNELNTHKSDIVYANYFVVEGSSSFKSKLEMGRYNVLFGNSVGACFLYKREVFQRNTGYDENLFGLEDYDFWLQATVHSTFRHIPEYLYNYRKHEDSLSAQIKNENTLLNKEFNKNLEICYKKLFSKFNLQNSVYEKILRKFHRKEKIDVSGFLKQYDQFIKDLTPIFNQLGRKKIVWQIDLFMRMNIFNHSSNQNLKTIILLFKKRPRMLFEFNKKRTIEMVSKCLYNT